MLGILFPKLVPLLVFSVIAVFLTLPLLSGGYIFTLDMVFSDKIAIPTITNHNYFLWLPIQVLSHFLTAEIVQKLILLVIIILSGYNTSRVVLFSRDRDGAYSYAAYLAGTIYAFNPFVYSRFISGQYIVLLGYALLPFFVLSLLKLLSDATWRRVIYMAILLAVIGFVSLHALGMCLIIALPIIGLWYYRHRRDSTWLKSMTLKLAGFAGLFLLLSSNWIIPILTGGSRVNETVSGFDNSDLAAFATNGDGLGVIGNILAMQGFWADAANLYLVPQDIYWWWWIPIVMLWILVSIGFYRGWRTMKGLSIAFAAMFVTAVVLATGTSGSIFAPINEWLVANVPFFAGYREPQKFVAIVVLVYAIFGALGVEQIIQWLRGRKLANWYINTIATSLLIIPIATAPLMLWGFNGQLKTSEYPREWYAMNTYLEETVPKDAKILALPWHLYMRFDFAGRIIANPMDKFFAPELVISNDPEFDGAKAYASTDTQTKLDSIILAEAPNRTDLGKKLADLDIEYVLLAKEFDYEKYNYLDKQIDLELVREDASLKLYKVKTSGN